MRVGTKSEICMIDIQLFYHEKESIFWQDSPPAAGRFSGSFHSAAAQVFYFIGMQFPMK